MASNWEKVSLGAVTTWLSGGTPNKSTAAFWSGDIPWISANSMHGTRFENSDLRITEAGLRSGSRIAPKNSVLLLVRGGALHNRLPVGMACRDLAFNQDVKALIANPELLDPWFLLYWLIGHERYLLEEVVEETGIGAGKLDTKRMQSLELSIPPLIEQRHIASIAKSIDEKIDLNRRINQTLEAMAQAIFKSWFVDFDPVKAKIAAIAQGQDPLRAAMRAISGKSDAELDQMSREEYDSLAATAALFPDAMEESELGEIPKGWKTGELSDLADFQNGYAFKTKDWSDEGHPVVKIGNVKPGVIDVTGCSFVTSDTVKELGRFALDRGNLLVGMTGYVGETGLVPGLKMRAYLNQRVGRLITRKGLDDIGYIYCLVRDPAYKLFAEGKAHGSAQANISGKDLIGYDVILPAQDLLNEFNAKMASILKKILANHEEGLSSAQLRDTLLPKLLSGELSVVDLDKEVAVS